MMVALCSAKNFFIMQHVLKCASRVARRVFYYGIPPHLHEGENARVKRQRVNEYMKHVAFMYNFAYINLDRSMSCISVTYMITSLWVRKYSKYQIRICIRDRTILDIMVRIRVISVLASDI